MSYHEFTFSSALEEFQIKLVIATEEPELYASLLTEFSQLKPFSPSPTFKTLMDFNLQIYNRTVRHSEKMRTTTLIWPFLQEIWQHYTSLAIWQEEPLDVDHKMGLTGKPDYYVTANTPSPKSPYFIVMEVKKGDEDFEEGWGQALAAMKGSQILNKQKNNLEIPIYGLITSGILWEFGKIKGNQFLKFPRIISIFEPKTSGTAPDEIILTYLNCIFSECEKFVKNP